jgi:hypothetical protein
MFMITETGFVVPDASALHELNAYGAVVVAVTVASAPESK